MSRRTHHDDAARRVDTGADAGHERDTPGADAFAVIRESRVPWDDDEPIIREDERYERIDEVGGGPLSPRDRTLLDEVGGDGG